MTLHLLLVKDAAARLREAGIATTHALYRGVTHECFTMPVVDQAKHAVAEAAGALRQAFDTV